MRYEKKPYSETEIWARRYLDSTLSNYHMEIVYDDEGMKLKRTVNAQDIILAINNEGLVVVNLTFANIYNKVVSTFFREVLGKNMLVIWRRGNVRVYIYPEGESWTSNSVKRYTRLSDTAIFDLLLNPVYGLKKMAPKPKKDPVTGRPIRKTNSQW